MKVTNTSVYPTPAIQVLIHFVLRIEKHDLSKNYINFIKVTKCKTAAYRGRCNGDRILLRIASPESFTSEIVNKYRKRAPEYVIRNWREAFVALLAHEAEHARHFEVGHGVDEVGCEHAASRALNAYREQEEFILARIKGAIEAQRMDQYVKEQQEIARRSPEAKLVHLETKIATWKKKLKTAQTYLKKYELRRKRLLNKEQKKPSLEAAKKI